MKSSEKRIAVIGVGNLLLGDEGVGVHTVAELKKNILPPAVKVIDGGTAGIDLLYHLEDANYAIIVDCIQADAAAGTIFRIPFEELATGSPAETVSLHDLSLKDMLFLAKYLGRLPPTVIYGVQPETVRFSDQPSQSVRGAIPRLIELIKEEICNLMKEI